MFIQTVVQTPTPDLRQSRAFYLGLGYQLLEDGDSLWLTDGHCLLRVNADRFARAGLVLYRSTWSDTILALGERTVVHHLPDGPALGDGTGCWIYLQEGEPEVSQALSDSMGALPGNFVGLSLEAPHIAHSISIWKALGFQPTQGSVAQGWVTLSNAEGFSVSLMVPGSCPHLFFNPSLTFFNSGRNSGIIAGIRRAGIPITEEITVFNDQGEADNIIIRDPGGLGFFIFND